MGGSATATPENMNGIANCEAMIVATTMRFSGSTMCS